MSEVPAQYAVPYGDQDAVLFERRGATALLTLSSPATRNAFTPEVHAGMQRALAQLRSDPELRVVVLTGAGGHFSAGGDIRGMAANSGRSPAEMRTRMHAIQDWFQALITLDKPVLAAVDGAAFGAGFSLALAADYVLATPRARFCMSFLRIGLVPDCGAFFTLPRVVGLRKARELMLSARELGAQEALALGIVNELQAGEALLPRALALAAAWAEASPVALSLIKRSTCDAGVLSQLLEAEANAQAVAAGSEAHREAVRRFLAKEPTRFVWPARSDPG